MPYLQLDVPGSLEPAAKAKLASAIGACYAEMMETNRSIPSVVVRGNDGGPWRWEDGELREVAVLMCDGRRGRGREQREHACRRLAELIAAQLGMDFMRVVVEFTQHDADEMFRYGALAPEWSAAEAK
jgi:phenylpyruvate tautomerase PptA (4-oxalocrotonate tautomerase family)